jgi:hypothetical protein
MYANLVEGLDTSSELGRRYKIPGFVGLYTMFNVLFKDTSDKKFFKQVWDIQKTIPIFHLYGNTVYKIQPFMSNFSQNYLKLTGKCINNNKGATQNKMDFNTYSNNFLLLVSKHYMNLIAWMSRVESEYSEGSDNNDTLQIQTTLIIQGLSLSQQISDLVKNFIYLNIDLDKSLSVIQVIHLCRCIEMIKIIKHTFFKITSQITKNISVIYEFISFNIQKIIENLKKALESKKNLSSQEIDQVFLF